MNMFILHWTENRDTTLLSINKKAMGINENQEKLLEELSNESYDELMNRFMKKRLDALYSKIAALKLRHSPYVLEIKMSSRIKR